MGRMYNVQTSSCSQMLYIQHNQIVDHCLYIPCLVYQIVRNASLSCGPLPSLWQLWRHQRFFWFRRTQTTVTHDFPDLLRHPRAKQSISGPSKTCLFSLVTCKNVRHDFFVKDGRYNYSITFVQQAVVNANPLSVCPVFRNSLLDLLLWLRPT